MEKETKGLMDELRKALWPNADHSSLVTQTANSDDGEASNKADNLKMTLESQFENFNTAMVTKLKTEVGKLEAHNWKVSVRGEEVRIEDVVEKFVGVVACAKDFVGQAVSTNPHAALAWSAVCFGLQVSRQSFCFNWHFINGAIEKHRLTTNLSTQMKY
jgi:hypothetical protein